MKFGDYIKERMESMNYGELPPIDKFKRQFRKEAGAMYNYELKGSDARTATKAGIPTDGDFTDKELYSILQKLQNAWKKGDDGAGDLASSIMYTLGYEWI